MRTTASPATDPGTPATDVPPATPAATPGNGAIAFSRTIDAAHEGAPAHAAIVIRSLDGDERTIADDAIAGVPPSWSPDGRSLAYLGDGGLSVLRPGGSAERLVPCDPPSCLGIGPPAWSPDGVTIAFGWLGERGSGLAVAELDDPNPTVVADLEVEGAPSWSPDGLAIAVPSEDRIVVVDPTDGTTTATVGFAGRLGDRVSWSPDGESFVVDGEVGGSIGIFVVPVGGGAPVLLSACPDDGCTDRAPAWSPDGRHVVFTRARDDEPGGDGTTGDVYSVEATGGVARPLTEGPALDCCPSWQPVAAG